MRIRITAFLAVILLCAAALTSCAGVTDTDSSSSAAGASDTGKVTVVCTNFAEYDFVRQIGGDKVNNILLIRPGSESHSYEPSPQDIITIQSCGIFVYVGGDSDQWVSNVLSTMDTSRMKTVKLMDCVETVEEESVEGMQGEKDEESGETEYDEHVWTSPVNAMAIVKVLRDTLCSVDASDAGYFSSMTEDYLQKLSVLDSEFRDVVKSAKRREIIVADRFPFLYLCREYGLTYYAAFPGCSTDTEADASTVAFIIDKVKTDGIPVVFHIELSNEEMCASVCEATGAKSEQLNAVHNVTADDFAAGVTYIDLMEHNVTVLKEALN